MTKQDLSTQYKDLLAQCRQINANSNNNTEVMQAICDLLKQELEAYDWVGFYMGNEQERILHLGPYAGAHTDHLQIPFGKGICGQAADTKETFLIDDVSAEDNYIACSIDVKSEIVVPMFKDGAVIGQIDIDSHLPAAFSNEDDLFLQEICEMIAQRH